MSLIDNLKTQIRDRRPSIVFPEGNDSRVLRAAIRLNEDGDIKPIVLGNVDEIKELASYESVDLGDIEIIDPESYEEFDAMIDAFVERRAGKATIEDAREVLRQPNYFGTMYIYMDKAEGMVSGA